MALNFNNLKTDTTDAERLAMAWQVMEQSMAGQNVSMDQVNSAQWVIHQLSPRNYDDPCVSWGPIQNSPPPSGKKKKKRKKKSG